jgi:hypothetical protein
VENGVPSGHVFVNGNPVYQLYKDPYKRYFKQRDALAKDYGLDGSKRWVFIPENYKWAFFSDEKLESSANRGGNLEEMIGMRAFCQESLVHLMRWCHQVSQNGKVEVIFRPRPATNLKLMEEFFQKNVGIPGEHLHFIKGDSVREWIMGSDVVISSVSTSLIESAIYGRSIHMVEPVPIPESLQCDWYGFVPHVYNNVEFEEACMNEPNGNYRELQMWAQSEMLCNGDPIVGLADFLGHMITDGNISAAEHINGSRSAVDVRMPVSSNMRVGVRFKRFVKNMGLAIHSLLSAVKILLSAIFSDLSSAKNKSTAQPEKTVKELVVNRLNRAFALFKEGFQDTDYFNPVTHEKDEFTDIDVQKRMEKWFEILAD